MCTQAFGDEDGEEEAELGALTWLVGGEPEGHAINLPGASGAHIVCFGRERQPAARSGPDDRTLTVDTLLLKDPALGPKPNVSGLHAEISFAGSNLVFTALGKSYSFINEQPYHSASKIYPRDERLFDGDVLRIGGNLRGRPGGEYSKFVLRVDHPPLGERPAPV